MSLILESDIIYNVLPHATLPTIGDLLCLNTLINKLCSDKNFWKAKLRDDYQNVTPKSDKWVNEYKCIYETYVRSVVFINKFIRNGIARHMNATHTAAIVFQNGFVAREIPCNGRDPIFITHVRDPINPDHFQWIPEISDLVLKNQIHNTTSKNQIHTSAFYRHTYIKKFCVAFTVLDHGTKYLFEYHLSREEFTDYLINLHYNHNIIYMGDYICPNDKEIIFF